MYLTAFKSESEDATEKGDVKISNANDGISESEIFDDASDIKKIATKKERNELFTDMQFSIKEQNAPLKMSFCSPNEEKVVTIGGKEKVISISRLRNSESLNEATPKREQGLDSFEHKYIGDVAFSKFFDKLEKKFWGNKEELAFIQDMKRNSMPVKDGDITYNVYKLEVTNKDKKGAKLSAGSIIALAGDFCGVPGKPICMGKSETDENDRFNNAYNDLVNMGQDKVNGLLNEVIGDGKQIKEAVIQGKKPNVILEKLNSDYKYGALTRVTFFPMSFLSSRYLSLAKWGFDHFGKDAEKAYIVGHRIALKTAIEEAKSEKDPNKKHILFIRALSQELFSLHYFTDLYASGHMRTPRRDIYDHFITQEKHIIGGTLAGAGLLAKCMHDEDNQNGLEVQIDGKTCQAKGDDYYFEETNGAIRKELEAKIEIALDNIYCACFEQEYHEDSLLKYVPRLTANNKDPLIKVEEEKQTSVLKIRKEWVYKRCFLLEERPKTVEQNVLYLVKNGAFLDLVYRSPTSNNEETDKIGAISLKRLRGEVGFDPFSNDAEAVLKSKSQKIIKHLTSIGNHTYMYDTGVVKACFKELIAKNLFLWVKNAVADTGEWTTEKIVDVASDVAETDIPNLMEDGGCKIS